VAQNKSEKALYQIMTAQYSHDSKYRKVSDWYSSCMDLATANRRGSTPLKPYLDKIDGIKSKEQLWDTLAYLQLWSIPTMFKLSVSADEKQPLYHDLFLDAGGMILPDSTYYDNTTDDGLKYMTALKGFLKNITMLAGYSEEVAQLSADRTMEVETMLAQFTWDEPLMDLEDSYLHRNVSQLEEHAPHIQWRKYFGCLSDGCHEAGTSCLTQLDEGRKKIVLDAPYFYQKLSEAFKNNTADYWAPYLRTHLIYNLSPLLSEQFLDTTFRLDAELSGVETKPPRWKKCVAAVKHALPGLTDKLYIERAFPAKARQDAETMMEQLREAFIANLIDVNWMDKKTKDAALLKARSIEFNIGEQEAESQILNDYPVTAKSYFNNSMNAYHLQKIYGLSQVDKAVDRREWSMRASTVNAYYDNGVTALFVPAAVLQPPFFSAKYTPARNFGGIGCIMGHEFTHGFDDTGRKFDAKSRLREWWKKPVVDKFEKHSQCISTLYDGFTIADEDVDGNGTLGENIADMGGLKISLEAFSNLHMEEHGDEPSEEQKRLFFVSYAQNWCDKERYQAQQTAVLTDEHSPNLFRVNGPISQNREFSQVFGCPAGSPMNPAQKCVLWKDTKVGEQLATFNDEGHPRGLRG